MKRSLKTANSLGSAPKSLIKRALALAVGLFTLAWFCPSAKAQIYIGRRIAPPPFVPLPYRFGAPFFGPTVLGPAPGSVRIRAPFFSLNIDPGYPSYGDSVYSYRSYRPSYGYPPAIVYPRAIEQPYGVAPGYRSSARYQAIPNPPVGSRPLYSPGSAGGIPDLTPGAISAVGRPAVTETFSERALAEAAETLWRALERRPDDAEIWIDYLKPDAILAAIKSGRPTAELGELRDRYEGVVMNPELQSFARLPGFQRTRSLLGQWLDQFGQATGETVAEPAPGMPTDAPSATEELPTPADPTRAQ